MLGNKEAGMRDNITPTQFRESDGVDDWRVLGPPGGPGRAGVVAFWGAGAGAGAPPRQPRRGSRRSAWSGGTVLIRADGGATPGRRRRDPRRGMGAVRARGSSYRGSARRGRPDGARQVRAILVDAGGCRGQRG